MLFSDKQVHFLKYRMGDATEKILYSRGPGTKFTKLLGQKFLLSKNFDIELQVKYEILH